MVFNAAFTFVVKDPAEKKVDKAKREAG